MIHGEARRSVLVQKHCLGLSYPIRSNGSFIDKSVLQTIMTATSREEEEEDGRTGDETNNLSNFPSSEENEET